MNLESLADIELPNMELSVGDVEVNGVQALQLTYRWKSSGDIAFVKLHVGDAMFEFDAGPGLRDFRETLWWKVISTFRFQDE